ncbi:MAG: type II toxin-antitoxin system mRNA interferase toxin, RelE/StbE family [Candidatus Altiarchaeota archaeon]|nr:type II toxin-antitoxin system mRNA interferase toxin, RelE/StbE family [Candidatus Altiarchaeota archaeon]
MECVMGKTKSKNPVLFAALQKKINRIARLDPGEVDHFKNLRHDMSHLKRVQIGSFVLTFQIRGDTIVLEDFDHHDSIYKR